LLSNLKNTCSLEYMANKLLSHVACLNNTVKQTIKHMGMGKGHAVNTLLIGHPSYVS
jgi:hypothetical protein